jgi:hypothetical protein
MTDDLVLYDHPASPCARRVRIALLGSRRSFVESLTSPA